MKTIKMVAKIGDLQVPVGTCNSAQARILVRDDLAAWQDGDLILFIRKAHLALLDANVEAWRCKEDDHNVSQAELDRRKAWFISFMPLASRALTHKQGSERDVIHAAALQMVGGVTVRHGPYEGIATNHTVGQVALVESEPTPRTMVGEVDEGHRNLEDIIQDSSLDEATKDKFRAVARHFGDDQDFVDVLLVHEETEDTREPPGQDDDKLQTLWEDAPDVSRVFGINNNDGVVPVKDEEEDFDIEFEEDFDMEFDGDSDEGKTNGGVRLDPYWPDPSRIARSCTGCFDPWRSQMYVGPGLSRVDEDEIDAQEGSIVRIPAEFVLSKRSPYMVALAEMSEIEAAKEVAQEAIMEQHAQNHTA